MGTREINKTLYSRNGIRITKTENIKDIRQKMSFVETTHEERLENIALHKNSGEWVYEKCTSPLGFYYTKKRYENYTTKKPKSATYRKYILWLETEKYELEYPIKYYANGNTQSINIEMRPWDILPGYKGMPENMINALVQETNKFLDILFGYRNNIKMKTSFNVYKKSIMIDLFGYEDGPKIQPNDIKILSHGFDLKTSFRKRKEE